MAATSRLSKLRKVEFWSPKGEIGICLKEEIGDGVDWD